jgi:hypothetical protein
VFLNWWSAVYYIYMQTVCCHIPPQLEKLLFQNNKLFIFFSDQIISLRHYSWSVTPLNSIKGKRKYFKKKNSLFISCINTNCSPNMKFLTPEKSWWISYHSILIFSDKVNLNRKVKSLHLSKKINISIIALIWNDIWFKLVDLGISVFIKISIALIVL